MSGNDGQLVVSINGGVMDGLTDLANSLGEIDEIRWGLVDGTLSTSFGSLKHDEFSSWQ